MKKLALGVKSFEEIRDAKNDFVYVDKTKYIVEFAEGCRVIVFSRPPHFGKTLLVSTLENLFSGKKELFKGLYIYDKWNWQKTYPVIKIDFSDAQITTRESLEKFLSNLMSSIAKENGITLISGSSGMKFSELIQRLSEIKKQKVVILVDDCDNALWSNLKNPEDLEAVQMALGRFFQIVKSCDADIHFVLIMNVLKIIFSGIFSGFNNYTDETLDEKFSNICGYTQEELEKYFKDYIGALAKNYSWSKEKTLEAIKFWYGGYSWDGKTSIYNPTSILKLFSENTFSNYWLAGARSNFLPDIFKKENYCEFNFGEISVSDNFFSWPSGSISRLFQMGYLTVCAIKRRRGEHFSTSYILGWPNEEVKLSFARKILESLPKGKGKLIPLLEKLKDQIVKSFDTLNAKDMQKYLPSIYACIPQNKLKAKRGPYLIDNRLEVTESNYAAFFVFALKFLDFDVFGESRNFRESKNIVIKQAKQTIIAEVKYDEKSATLSRKVDSVLKQMKKQKYWENHICPDKKIVLLGLAFGDSGKTAKCKFEEVK